MTTQIKKDPSLFSPCCILDESVFPSEVLKNFGWINVITILIKHSQIKLIPIVIIILLGQSGFSQLSDLHYLPPLKQQSNNQAIREQAIYLSTPVTTAFSVNVFRGASIVPLTSFLLSKAAPVTYSLPDGDNDISLVSNINAGVVLNNSGLRFESTSGQQFYVNYRGRSASQGASLTSKGRAAMGTEFRWGGSAIRGNHHTMSASIGIMAIENTTNVTISGYNPNCEFRLQNDPDGITSNTISITLQAGQSYVLEAIKDETIANIDGWIGATITSNKNIVISNGLLNFGVNSTSGARDAGADQPVPVERLGAEFVFVRGEGGNLGEFPIIIGVTDDTDIFVNGSATPIANIDNGEYFEIPSTNYSGSSVGDNMYVSTSKDVYAYQVLSGGSGIHTIGLNFVAPVNCLLPDTVNNIPDIQEAAGITLTGGVTIIAATATPDANISVTDGSGSVTLPPSNPVSGSTDWKTFYISGLTGNVTVQSTGPIAVGFVGFSGARGVAGYFSGFDTVPNLNLLITGSGCFPSATIEIAGTEVFDAYQWYLNDSAIVDETNNTINPTGLGNYYVKVTKGPCTYDSNIIHLGSCKIITNRRITYRIRDN